MTTRRSDGSVEVACNFLGETEKAVKVVDLDTGEELWFPFSQVREMHKDKNDTGSIVVSEWIARQKGVIE